MIGARSPIFDSVDPELLSLIQTVGGNYAPYKMNITSGYRAPGGRGGKGFHPKGRALDVQLVDPKTGQALTNYQDPTQAQAYQAFANAVYNAASPEMKAKLRWGGYFREGGPGSYGALDLMHFDTGGDTTPMAGGSWAGGFNDEQAKLWGIKAGGGIGGAPTGNADAIGPPMPRAPMDYTPEQRRNAIASIESAGSGDYNALGVWTGDPKEGRDRAYGRYQIMGSNIPKWTQQVLGRTMTPDEFLRDPKAQDAVFDKIFGDYVLKHGESGAANMWFTGHPESIGRKDANGMDDNSYEARYLRALGAPLKMGDAYPDAMRPNPAGTPAPGTAVAGGATPATAPKSENKIGKGIGGIADALGGMFTGGGGGGASIPASQGYTPTATQMVSQPGQTFDAQAGEAQRQRLALAMQRLNTGKLWV